ncbi:hypothetical protein G7Z17_g2694 [Cylindrodendrum hubeiense]|uniref:Carrier domain-containing protein n=1 Tax=Cylindrodendrum hubeiense TaxID=595255 RepID=A0A9P5LE69_9HYPO|nr:hypothetical protein G7Z17_g2694 [Cylindrodendrum hubeiense]
MGSIVHIEETPVRPFVRPAVNFASVKRIEGCLHSLPELVDFNAQNNAAHRFCIQAKSDGLDTFTHADFKVAVSNCARWIQDNVPLRESTEPNAVTKMAPVALFMQSDFGLVVHEFALLSLGVPPLVLSPRLPPIAIMHLLEATSASSFIVSQRLSEPAKPALAALNAKGISTHVGLHYDSFHEPGVDVASKGTFEPPTELDSVILLLHSSGTTGLPKPIEITHRQLLFAVNCHGFATEEEAQGLNVSSLPLFHGFGLVAPGLSMSAGKTTVYPASDGIPNALSIVELVKRTKAKSLMTVPFLLDDIVDNEEAIKVLAGLDFVGTGGAALGAGVGDRLAQGGVKLLNFYGTTETGPLSDTFAPKDDYNWKYFRLRKDVNYKVTELDPKDGVRIFRLTVFPYGGTEGIEIADQLIRNEQYPDTDFAAIGRDDDVIVLATGEKADPLILETMLTEAPLVKSATAFGENRFNLGVIVEPANPIAEGEENAFKQSIWPIITAAGQKMEAYSRIPSQDVIVVVPANVTIPRTDKGSIPRKEVYALFDKQISEVYEKLAQGADDSIEALKMDNLEHDLKVLVEGHSRLQVAPSEWTTEDSLFDLGLDSLQALQLRRILIAAVSKTEAFKDVDVAKLIPVEFLYLNSSVREIASALSNGSSNSTGSSIDNSVSEVNKFVEMFTEKETSSADNAVVVLTGSSGSLGSHVLAKLVRSPNVKRVVVLLRKSKGASASDGQQYDRSSLKTRGITLSEDEWSKITSLQVDPTKEKLGLDEVIFKGLQENVTQVIHAAWPMNYLIRLPSFQYQFKFLQNLLELATGGSGNTKRRFVFISSIAAVAKIGLASGGRMISESPVDPVDAACGIGYADGKLVCEKILEQAASKFADKLEITYVRCGQITGARETGVWNSAEQIPMLLRSAQSIGSLPQLQGTLSWIPVDDAAAVISDITFSASVPPLVQHLENPVRQAWSDVVDVIGQQLNLPKANITFEEWIDKVVSAGGEEDDYPVRKLHAFFKLSFQAVACGHVILDTAVARTSSSTLRNLTAIDDATIQGYIRHWKDISYLKK